MPPFAASASPSSEGAGSVRLLEPAQAAEAFPAVFEAYVPTRVGELDRPRGEWAELLGNPKGALEDARHRFYACYERKGRIDAYAVYRVAPIDPADHWRRAVFLDEMCSLSDESYASLWRYLLGIDLTEERTRSRPVDEPLRYLLEDQRHLRTRSWGDRTWMRLVDVPQALARRRYGEEETLVIEVEDRFCPWNEGHFRLSIDGEGVATVERVDAAPDLALPVEVLGAVYLGGVPFAGMAAAGRIAECPRRPRSRRPRSMSEGLRTARRTSEARGRKPTAAGLGAEGATCRASPEDGSEPQILSSLTTWACGTTVRTSCSRWGWHVMNST